MERTARTARYGSTRGNMVWGRVHGWAAVAFALQSLAALGADSIVAAAQSWGTAEELQDAVNAGYTFQRTSWDAALMNETHPFLKLEHILWSAKPRTVEFTVFTQLSIDRLPTLYNQCTTFLGPISAAVYMALVQTNDQGADALSDSNQERVKQAVARVNGLFARTESNATVCQLDLMLFYEVFDEDRSKVLYPVNYLRNYARLQVRTRLLAMIDVDMLMSTTLAAEMAQPDRVAYYHSLCPDHKAMVLPALEPTRPGHKGRSMAMRLARVDKAALSEVFGRNKDVMQFKLRVFPRGHTPTNYKYWLSEEGSQPYQVRYRRFYEPWFITCWDTMPWYDVRFRGYGMNKIILIASLNFYGFSFWVHPTAWIVHSPHSDTDARKEVARQASDVNKLKIKLPKNALYYQLTQLFGKCKRAMIKGDYVPATDPRQMGVLDKLQWLPRPPALVGKAIPEELLNV